MPKAGAREPAGRCPKPLSVSLASSTLWRRRGTASHAKQRLQNRRGEQTRRLYAVRQAFDQHEGVAAVSEAERPLSEPANLPGDSASARSLRAPVAPAAAGWAEALVQATHDAARGSTVALA
jgi:hypothetical protein